VDDQAPTSALKRRWFRFSLRGLLLVTVVAGLFSGWIAYQLNWVRQRNALTARHSEMVAVVSNRFPTTEEVEIGNRVAIGKPTCSTPGQLWLFGESAVPQITFHFFGTKGQTKPSESEMNEVQLARGLFPEAEIEWRLVKFPDPTR
jgi:hypothetical protein